MASVEECSPSVDIPLSFFDKFYYYKVWIQPKSSTNLSTFQIMASVCRVGPGTFWNNDHEANNRSATSPFFQQIAFTLYRVMNTTFNFDQETLVFFGYSSQLP